MILDKFIGDETQFSFKHRLLNIVLVFGIVISFWSAIANYLLDLGTTLVATCVISGIILIVLNYLSTAKKLYGVSLCLTVVISAFIIIPMMWINNGGTFGSIPLYIALFSSLGATLFSGYQRVAITICLIIIVNTLLMLEYKYPLLITQYSGDLVRYIDISIGLTTTIIANSLLFLIVIAYYNKEHEKASYYLAKVEKQKSEMEFQSHLEMINEKLQQEIDERRQIEQKLRENNDQLKYEITERIRAERAADEQKRQLETILEHSPGIIVQFDTDGRHTFISPSACDFGLVCQKLIGSDGALPQVQHSKEWLENFNFVLRQGKSAEFEIGIFINECKRFFSIQLVPEVGSCGDVLSILGFFRDLTDLKHTEKEMARLDRLNLIGQMAASIGHEVRNPMTTIRGFLQYFGRKQEFSRYTEEFTIMISELDRANEIITEFLSLAKNKSISLTKACLNQSIKAIYPLLEADAFERGYNIEVELGEIHELWLDEKDIRQLLLNLVYNGFEAIPDRGTVRIRTYQTGDLVVLAVQDNGCGIPQEVLGQLGTPFVTTKEKGTGLGLPVCYRIAERHNAIIEVETSSHGTTFSIKFPIHRQHNGPLSK